MKFVHAFRPYIRWTANKQIYANIARRTMTSDVESAKQLAAEQAVADHFSRDFKFVGIGSGSTIKYVVEAIAKQLGVDKTSSSSGSTIGFVPTGYQSRQVIVENGLSPVIFDALPDSVILDVAFDGADEVDEDLNCIKGGGACLFQEKLVAQRAKKFVCVADYRKAQSRLLTKWPTIPIEVAPIAAQSVLFGLRALGSKNPTVRSNPLIKSGPLKTDQDFFIIDAPFSPLLMDSELTESEKGDGTNGKWEVYKLMSAIRNITGVLEVGLFCGYDGIEADSIAGAKGKGQKPVAVYFGMEDGSVTTRIRKNGLS